MTLPDTFFPYTALFRSEGDARNARIGGDRGAHVRPTGQEVKNVGRNARFVGQRNREGRDQRRLRSGLGDDRVARDERGGDRSEEHTSELQSLMRNSYAVFCLNKKTQTT